MDFSLPKCEKENYIAQFKYLVPVAGTNLTFKLQVPLQGMMVASTVEPSWRPREISGLETSKRENLLTSRVVAYG